MMNKLKNIIFLLFLTLIWSCSSDDTQSNPTPEPEAPSVIKISVNGVEIPDFSVTVFRTENTFRIKDGIDCKFDASGKLGSFFMITTTLGPTPQVKTFSSFRYYSSHYFTFNLESVNEVTKRIKGSFSGYLYLDPTNLNSETKFVSGTFDLKYRDLIPAVFGLKNKAMINGNPWSKTIGLTSHVQETFTNLISFFDYSDDAYGITIGIDIPNNSTSTMTGTVYNFVDSSPSYFVKLSRFDPVSGTLINYNTTGTLTITKYEQHILTGTYSFTAVNPNDPNDVIQVTDGEFKTINIYG